MEKTSKTLKDARENLKLTINEVANSTKISSKVIEAIEAGDRSALPALTFLRGFIRTYAKHLKLDENRVMEVFNEEVDSPLHTTSPSKPLKTASKEELVSLSKLTSRTLTTLAIVFLFAIILFVKRVVEKYESEAIVVPPSNIEVVESPLPEEAATIALSPKEQEEVNLSERPQVPIGQPEVIDSEKQSDEASEPVAAEASTAQQPPKPLEKSSDLAAADAEAGDESKPTVIEKPKVDLDADQEIQAIIRPLVKVEPPPKKEVQQQERATSAEAEKTAKAKASAQIASHTEKKETPPSQKEAEPVNESPSLEETTDADNETATPLTAQETSPTEVEEQEEFQEETLTQEVILEALDNIQLEVSIDGNNKQTVSLKPQEIFILKAKRTLSLKLNDAGAVNLVHNGKDRGVPGDLGQPKTLNFP